ncbi:MAG: hypothetical protein ACX932_00595 [Gammaproteobacteria bacterium]
MKQRQMTLQAMIEEIEAIQPVLRFGRGRLAEFKEVLDAMEMDLATITTQVLWQKALNSLIALKGNLSATQKVVNVWQEKVRIFRGALNNLTQQFSLPEGTCDQDVLRARNGLAELTSEILHQREILAVQTVSLDEKMQLLEKQRSRVHSTLRAVRAPRLKNYMYSHGKKILEASL